MRADAQRNRERILAAARELVAGAGIEVTMDDIARRAGVAVGTLYRHFPTKEDLVLAVVDDSVARIAGLAEEAGARVTGGAAPGPELFTLFRTIAERHAADRAFKSAAARLGHVGHVGPGSAGGTAGRAVDAITALVERSRRAGAVRADLTLTDLLLLLEGVPGVEVSASTRARYVEIVLAGLATPLRRGGARSELIDP